MSGCFLGRDSGPVVLGMRAQTILLTHDSHYRVGAVPDGWSARRVGRHAMLLTDPETHTKMTTSVQCGRRREDLPLPVLMGHLFSGIPVRTLLATQSLTLDGRAALRSQSIRTVDGVPIYCDAVVINKDRCTFDFLLVTPQAQMAAQQAHFEQFFRGFQYRAP